MIKSTLSSMLIYFMSLFTIPNWATICLDKRDGGLGIKKLHTLNNALLSKWSWRFTFERESLWKQLITRRHGSKEGIAIGWAIEGHKKWLGNI